MDPSATTALSSAPTSILNKPKHACAISVESLFHRFAIQHPCYLLSFITFSLLLACLCSSLFCLPCCSLSCLFLTLALHLFFLLSFPFSFPLLFSSSLLFLIFLILKVYAGQGNNFDSIIIQVA